MRCPQYSTTVPKECASSSGEWWLYFWGALAVVALLFGIAMYLDYRKNGYGISRGVDREELSVENPEGDIESIDVDWESEVKKNTWHFRTTFVADDTPANRRDDPRETDLTVLEQNELGEYRTRPLSDILETTDAN